MQRHTRIYPVEKSPWLSMLLLVLAAVVILSGLMGRSEDGDVSIVPVATATPIPLDASFDETIVEKEITLPSSTWFALQLGAFENQKSASEMAQQFSKRGAAGYIWNDGKYRALAAVYPSREDAQLVREQLEMQHSIDTYLYQIDLPSIRVRMRGMQGQLDILQAGFVHGNDLIAQLQSLCVLMDRQEMNAEQAIARLNELAAQMETVALRLRQRFQAPRPAVVEKLMKCMEDYQAFCTQLKAKDSQVMLGAKIKHQTLVSLNGLKNVYDTLSHT